MPHPPTKDLDLSQAVHPQNPTQGETSHPSSGDLQGQADGKPEITQAASHRPWSSVGIFGSTFVTIFLAELGDKTQVTTLLISAESSNLWIVFLGAAAALITTSLIGVTLGHWLSRHIPPRRLEIASGLVLLMIGFTLAWDVLWS